MESHLSHNKTLTKKTLIVAVAVALLLMGVAFAGLLHTVVIAYDGQEIQVSTLASTVEDVLQRQDIVIKEGDKVIPNLSEKIKDGTKIEIHRAFTIKLVDGTTEQEILTAENNVKDLMESLNIQLQEEDKIEPMLEAPIGAGDTVTITRITRQVVVETQELPFQTIFKNNENLERGKTQKVQEGKKGLKEIQLELVYENGVEVSKEVLDEKIIENSTNEIIEKGTLALVATSRGDISRYSKMITMTATAYTADYASTGKKPGDKYYGVTASGTRVRPGVVAVDPKVIPLGTKLYIQSTTNGRADYGYAVAEDTGGAIKGNKIDLYFETSKEVKSFGRRTVNVYVLE
ncbi:3D domain-containing protein [Alkaliphilus oremlandii]|uniref:3D domain protein n=1 Tax=Alkaliphilus oremlandii (strain OhILAs) TaxID=350688 RepID=A8MK58_ALKOO|nr:3D domain-containing protein [Alkaliphilus oremlandii]ABW20190.1 3D domain protein [Alkaliphilus oremlandii OhILAs]